MKRGKHCAPTNRRCQFRDPKHGWRCIRYAGHPADLYGVLGHRCVKRPGEPIVYVCTRADLMAGMRPLEPSTGGGVAS